jgi:uncharacterized protein
MNKAKIFSSIVVLFICLQMSTIQLFARKEGLPVQLSPPKLVSDFANILSADERESLEQKLKQFDDSTSTEIAVVTVPNMGSYLSIEDFAYDLFNDWKIGSKKNNNGILLVVSIAERKSRIEVGNGLEGAVPDLISAEIIRNVLRPNFKEQQYYKGLNGSVDNLMAASKNEYQIKTTGNDGDDSGIPIIAIFLLILFIILFIKIARRSAGTHYMSRRGYRGWNDPWIGGGGFIGGGSSSGGGGFFDGDGGGGGFGGFGGGSSGGGGASGDW